MVQLSESKKILERHVFQQKVSIENYETFLSDIQKLQNFGQKWVTRSEMKKLIDSTKYEQIRSLYQKTTNAKKSLITHVPLITTQIALTPSGTNFTQRILKVVGDKNDSLQFLQWL